MEATVTILDNTVFVVTDETGRVTVTSEEPSPSQAGITFEDEGVSLGTRGTVNEVDFVGSAVTATRVGDKLTVTITGGSAGSGDVVGPASAVSGNVAVFSGPTGKIIADGGFPDLFVVLANDKTNNNAIANTLEDVTGFAFPVVSGESYYFDIFILYDSALASNGARFTVNGGTATRLTYLSDMSNAAVGRATNSLNAYQLPAAASANSAYTTGNFGKIEGIILAGSNTPVQVQCASESSGVAITLRAGVCVIRYRRLS